MFDEQATTHVFRRVQTRGSCLGTRSRLQPYRGLPFAGRRGLVLPEQIVTPRPRRAEQVILGRVSEINSYIEAHPDQAEAVGFVLAAAQGPKGLMMWAADKALSETSFGDQVAQYKAHLEGLLGKAIAEGVEREELDVEYDNDAYLLGGGALIATLLVGSAVGGAGGEQFVGNEP